MVTRVAVTSRIVLPVPPEQAWRAVVDWPRQGQWMLATRVRGGHGAGAQVVARTGIGPLGFTDTMVITHWEPPRRCVVAHTGRVIRPLVQRGMDLSLRRFARLAGSAGSG